MTEEIWEERCRVEEADSRELLDEELQQDKREQSPVHVPSHSPAADLRKEQQRNKPALMLRGHRDGRVRALKFNLTVKKVATTYVTCLHDSQ